MIDDNAVLHIAPQILTAESTGGGGGAGAGRGSLFSGSVELGRRLLLAARHGHTSTVLELMAKGAPFTTDWLGTSPLHLAAGGAHVETCAVLLRAGVSRDARTKVERTPLHLAAHAGHTAVAQLLLDNGAAVDCRDMLRMTPLHWAAARGHAGVAAALLRAGADPLALSKFHKSARALAAARRDRDMLRLMDDALKEREAADSDHVLREATENISKIPAAEQQRALESIERLQETVKPVAAAKQHPTVIHTEGTKIEFEKPAEAGSGGGGGGGAALLRKHGITLLPHDDTTTVLNAIQSGRTVVLSDAGKLMLKESVACPVGPAAPAAAPAAPPASKGVILTAAPVRSPPRPGVKIFTLNNKLLAMPKENKVPINKIKLVNLPQDTRFVSSSKLPLKAKTRVRPAAAAAAHRSAVKTVMHKAYNKLHKDDGVNGLEAAPVTPASELTKALHGSPLTAANSVASTITVPGTAVSGIAPATITPANNVLCVPQEFLSSNSTQYLRAQLLSAHQTIQELNNRVAALQGALAQYENV